MLCKTRGIVLHSIPYNDKYSIIYMYTEAFGRASYLVARSRGKKSSVSKALFMPLSVVEMEVEHLNKRDLHRIRETKLCYPLTEVFCNPVKNILALFLSEILFRVVKETEPDPRLFEYLFESIQLLELSDKGVANFHLVFLLRLLHYLGIYPNVESYVAGSCFDMLNGVFVDPDSHVAIDFDQNVILLHLFDRTVDTAGRYDFLPFLERVAEFHQLFLTLLLRTDHKEIHHGENQHHHNQKRGASSAGRSGSLKHNCHQIHIHQVL